MAIILAIGLTHGVVVRFIRSINNFVPFLYNGSVIEENSTFHHNVWNDIYFLIKYGILYKLLRALKSKIFHSFILNYCFVRITYREDVENMEWKLEDINIMD